MGCDVAPAESQPVSEAYLVVGVEAHVLVALFTVVVCVVCCILG